MWLTPWVPNTVTGSGTLVSPSTIYTTQKGRHTWRTLTPDRHGDCDVSGIRLVLGEPGRGELILKGP